MAETRPCTIGLLTKKETDCHKSTRILSKGFSQVFGYGY